MIDFEYIARTTAGERVVGVVEADSEAAALRVLDERALFPVRLVGRESSGISRATVRVRLSDLGLVYGQLADLLGAGVPLLRSLDSIVRSTDRRGTAEVLSEIRDEVADGSSLTDAMRKRPGVFPLLHVAMVQAGERASFLEDVLSGLSTFIERLDELRGKVRGALIYPALLAVLGTSVMVGALLFFVPRFEPLLEGVEKPLPTVLLFAASSLLRNWWFAVLLALVVAVVALVTVWNSEVGRRTFEVWRARIPVVGHALKMVAITRFCRILGTMTANGVPLLQALAITRDATGSRLLAGTIDDATESVRAGGSLTEPLRRGGFVPPQILAMIGVAEESNQLQKVLIQIADTVERRTHRQVDAAVRLVEPVILCLVAAAIGSLALGLLLPIFTIAGSLGSG